MSYKAVVFTAGQLAARLAQRPNLPVYFYVDYKGKSHKVRWAGHGSNGKEFHFHLDFLRIKQKKS
jgi:hypothetical protein